MKEYKDGQLVPARRDLNDAIINHPGALPETLAAKARAALTDIADKTLFSPDVTAGDPYVFQYVAKNGDTGTDMMNKGKNAFENNPNFVLKLNKLTPATKLTSGQTVKFIRGPFAGLVNKKGGYLEVYLFPSSLDPVFLKRVPVTIGTENAVPLGNFKVAKMAEKAPWLPPGGSQKAVPFGTPDYPMDSIGHWIALGTSNICALHALKSGSSVSGYVVMKSKDLDEVYNLFLERSSCVYVMSQ